MALVFFKMTLPSKDGISSVGQLQPHAYLYIHI